MNDQRLTRIQHQKRVPLIRSRTGVAGLVVAKVPNFELGLGERLLDRQPRSAEDSVAILEVSGVVRSDFLHPPVLVGLGRREGRRNGKLEGEVDEEPLDQGDVGNERGVVDPVLLKTAE